jgi:Flp pilus assembly protein TadB
MPLVEVKQLQAILHEARRAERAAQIQLAICVALLVVGVLLGLWGSLLGGVVFFFGVFGSRVATRDLRRHRDAIHEIEQKLEQASRS